MNIRRENIPKFIGWLMNKHDCASCAFSVSAVAALRRPVLL